MCFSDAYFLYGQKFALPGVPNALLVWCSCPCPLPYHSLRVGALVDITMKIFPQGIARNARPLGGSVIAMEAHICSSAFCRAGEMFMQKSRPSAASRSRLLRLWNSTHLRNTPNPSALWYVISASATHAHERGVMVHCAPGSSAIMRLQGHARKYGFQIYEVRNGKYAPHLQPKPCPLQPRESA